MVTGSCGHALTGQEAEGFNNYISIMDHDRDGNPSVSYKTVCDPCKQRYKENGLLLNGQEQVNSYLNGEIKYPKQ